MKVQAHRLPEPFMMIGGLASDPTHGCVWLGMAGSTRMIWRLDLESGELRSEPVDGYTSGYSYVHRSLTPAPDGRVYAGVTWLLGAGPGKGRIDPFSPGAFSAVWKVMHWVGTLMSSCRTLCRDPDGTWRRTKDHRYMSADLCWDSSRGKLLRLSPRGVTATGDDGSESVVEASRGGFVHELNVSPAGDLLLVDGDGQLHLRRGPSPLICLGDLGDGDVGEKAAPGIDSVAYVAPRYFVGGTRNRARPFVVDIETATLTVLPALPTAPRASALAVTSEGTVYLAAGVGRVGLYRILPEERKVENLGAIEAGLMPCHHLHDLVAVPDGRLFGGEFYPLDVPAPPWPDRPCHLWELTPRSP